MNINLGIEEKDVLSGKPKHIILPEEDIDE
jgi:hypothetical protein